MANIGGVQMRYQHGTFWRFDGIHQKVPFYNLTTISATKWEKSINNDLNCNQNLNDFELFSAKTSFFIGSKSGLAFFDADLQEWYVFQGDGWIVGNNILKILKMDQNNIITLTNNGLTHVYRQNITYEEKANIIQKVYDSGRHGRTDLGLNHPLYGIVSQINLEKYGNLKNFTQGPTDNDGLWNIGLNRIAVLLHFFTEFQNYFA